MRIRNLNPSLCALVTGTNLAAEVSSLTHKKNALALSFLTVTSVPLQQTRSREGAEREAWVWHPGNYFDHRGIQKTLSHFLGIHLHSQSLPPPPFGCLQRHWTPDMSDRNYISVIWIQKKKTTQENEYLVDCKCCCISHYPPRSKCAWCFSPPYLGEADERDVGWAL